MRPLFSLCVLALFGSGATADDPYPYPDHVHSMFGSRVTRETTGEVLQPWRLSVCRMGDFNQKKEADCSLNVTLDTPIYLNGERYDSTKCTGFEDPHNEILGWYSLTGPCKVENRKDGGYDFTTLTGKELEARLAFAGMKPGDPKLTATAIQKAFPNTKTAGDCRKVWDKFKSGEYVWDADALALKGPIPAGQRRPLPPPAKVDPRSIPIIKPDVRFAPCPVCRD